MSHVTVLCRHEAAPAQVEVVGEGGRPEPVHPLAPASTHVRRYTCQSTQPRVSCSHVSPVSALLVSAEAPDGEPALVLAAQPVVGGQQPSPQLPPVLQCV